ncbi:MAG: ATP synthase subunit b [Deltaproteobacteria bacterium ADurb.Bin151]|jgi:F-type H+-transporting ATPase subunit b|nr:ATP synthase F0 subunit B [Smithella sp.]OQB55059.1 MAG: ATP synthase subunit b [Deltaproteobacteria bacterium ADurb.Bin151]HNZ10596.1 ATP synthase F0 subunit B [Smithellaceae bacterium]HOG81483.1 ATP synthase F0 subunit B [Smithellaceae bacterium]HOQ41792.1 ATP synthase F0 subunit B [Smithellaceae bacterium]
MKSSTRSIHFSLLLSLLFVLVSVCVAFASGGGEGGHDSSGQWKSFAFKTLNAVLIIGFLAWMLAPKIKEFFSGRRQEIKESLETTAVQKAEAEKQYREYAEKIDKASLEIDGIFDMIKAQGVVEKQKIIEDAEKVAKKMKEDAQARLEQELKKASSQLRNEAVALSVQMAEEILKKNVTTQDHEGMVKEYMDKVVTKN